MSVNSEKEEHAVLHIELRDYFAAKAMQGILSDSDMYAALSKVAKSAGKTDLAGLARAAYEYADAMLVEREK